MSPRIRAGRPARQLRRVRSDAGRHRLAWSGDSGDGVHEV